MTITKFINYLFAANYRPVLEGYNRERVSTTNFTLCKNISEKIIAKFGVPKTIISDNRIIFRFHNFESPRWLQSKGKVQRFMQPLTTII